MTQPSNEELYSQLEHGINELGLCLPTTSISLLIDFARILCKWNQVYNLTSITLLEDIIVKHILDSLSIAPFINGPHVIDIGSGAGFPGIPCAFALPALHFTLLDSNGKKTRFLTHVVGELGLINVDIVQDRVEDYRPSQCFNTIVTRACSSLQNVSDLARHLACKEGELLIMKGQYPKEELENLKERVKVYPLEVPGLNEQRHLVLIEGLGSG